MINLSHNLIYVSDRMLPYRAMRRPGETTTSGIGREPWVSLSTPRAAHRPPAATGRVVRGMHVGRAVVRSVIDGVFRSPCPVGG